MAQGAYEDTVETGLVDAEELRKIKRERKSKRQAKEAAELAVLRAGASRKLARAITLAGEKGASTVFSTRPLEKFGFALKSKRDFRDFLRMHYLMRVEGLPERCACGKPNSLGHSQECSKGGFLIARHRELQLETASLSRRAGFKDVGLEPQLQPLSGEKLKGKSANRDPGARADLMVRGFFQKYRCTFFDMKVAYPAAASYFDKEPAQLYKLLEDSKKREYRQRIAKVEDGDFVPMVMLSTGSMGMAVKRLCRMIAEKEKRDYAEIAAIARASFSFALARAALVCLRGTRARYVQSSDPLSNVDSAVEELELR